MNTGESIHFRCWYCGKRYMVKRERSGEHRRCSCGRRVRVPKYSWGNCRAKSLVDWLVEAIVYAGGGALLGFCLACLMLATFPFVIAPRSRLLFVTLPMVGFLVGLFGGEQGIGWLGRSLRRHEEKLRH
ncbi:MAG: hypothetical protein KatS3mg105_2748 [Gemmatales bacterium]|nr:MAG: hypothetical protein KatS3mg105_2748 [Gemmatales bacterium]